MLKAVLSLLVLVYCPILVSGQDRFVSPDGELTVKVSVVGKLMSESQLEFLSSKGRLLKQKNFSSPDGEHGERVSHGVWTADSRYFVFNTESSGGHQPWHIPTYVYFREKNRVYLLDNLVGPITSDFTLSDPDTVVTTRFINEHDDQSPIRIELNTVVR